MSRTSGTYEATAVTIPAATTPNWRRRVLIAGAISLLASGLMIAASFMPWLGSEGGRTLSGWDLYELQRDSGNNVLIIPGFFTDPEGRSVAFCTGLATLLSGLCVVGLTIVFLALSSLLRRRKSLTPDRPPLSARLVMGLHLLALLVAVSPPALNARSYFEGGAASGASLEYGLILLWAATYVGSLGSWLGVYSAWDRSKRQVLTYLASAVVFALAVAFAIAMIAGNLLPRQ